MLKASQPEGDTGKESIAALVLHKIVCLDAIYIQNHLQHVAAIFIGGKKSRVFLKQQTKAINRIDL